MSQQSIIAAVDAVVEALFEFERLPEAKGMRAIRDQLAEDHGAGDRAAFREHALYARSRAYGMGGLFDIIVAPRAGLSLEEANDRFRALVSAMVREINPLRDEDASAIWSE